MYDYVLHTTPANLTWTFAVRTGAEPPQELTVSLPAAALQSWEQARQTRLRRQEQYAVAKLALFRRLDEGTGRGKTMVSDDELAEVLAELELR